MRKEGKKNKKREREGDLYSSRGRNVRHSETLASRHLTAPASFDSHGEASEGWRDGAIEREERELRCLGVHQSERIRTHLPFVLSDEP